MGFADAVDAGLRAMEATLGTTAPPVLAPLSPPMPTPLISGWEGPASRAALSRSQDLEDTRRELYQAHPAVEAAMGTAVKVITDARTSMRGVWSEWQRDKAAVAPFWPHPEAQAALVAAGQLRLNEARQIITQAADQLNVIAATVRQRSAALPMGTTASTAIPPSSHHGQAQADDSVRLVDYRRAPIPAPGPDSGTGGASDPAATLGLPPYKPASLPNDEARRVYAEGKIRIVQQDEELARKGVSIEERARIASTNRNALRSWIRDIMSDRDSAALLDRSEPNMTWDQVVNKYKSTGLSGDQLYSKIVEKSVGSRAAVDAQFGIDPKNPGELPPVRPSAPATVQRPPIPEIPRSVPVEPIPPEGFSPRIGGGIMPDDAMPHVVDLPGELAGEPEIPILGDGLPDHRN